jgi:3-oxoacyl-[acyl-carrier-protein] synthase II
VSRRRVVVTGVGTVTPLGCSFEQYWDGLAGGRSAVGPLRRFDADRFTCRLAAEVTLDDVEVANGRYGHEIRRMDLFVHFALAAARAAVADSNLPGLPSNGHRPPDAGGVFLGVGMGGLPHMENGVLHQEARGPRKTHPYLIPSLIPTMAAGMVGLDLGIEGPHYTLSSACSSGTQALGEALWAIRSGRLSWALAGGTEAVITPIAFSGFQAMRALSTLEAGSTPRPFDRRRDGMVVGEGAALFVLEEHQRAIERGAEIYGELKGYATVSGADGIVLGSTAHTERCMTAAVEDAGLTAQEIDAVFSRAGGLVHCDLRELEAIRRSLWDRGGRPAATSIEGHIGHTFGASGPLNLAAALGALAHQRLPPTLHHEDLPPEVEELDVVTTARPARLRNCLIDTFGFGGANAALVCGIPSAATHDSTHGFENHHPADSGPC